MNPAANNSEAITPSAAPRARRWSGAVAALILAGLAAGAALVQAADVDRTQQPKVAEAPPLKLPKVQTQTLPNGLELAVVEMHEVPVVDVTLILSAGASRDPEDLPGLATFVANMLDEGAGGRDALGLADEIAFLGATLSSAAGAEHATVRLHSLKRRLDAALGLMADVVLRPAFADSEIVRQRELRSNALLQLRDQPTSMAPIAFDAIVFGSAHPYGRPSGGTEESTARLDRARVTGFYEKFYRPNVARLLIVGDITPAEAKKLVTARFGEWAKAEVPALPVAQPPAPGPRTFYLVDKPGAAQSVIRMGHPGVARSTPDYHALQVLNTILGGSFTSRLNMNLRETRGYTYGAGSRFDMRRLAGPFLATASVVTDKTDSSLVEFFKELRAIRDQPVPATELEKAKSYLILGLPGEFETTSGAAGQYLDLLAHDLPLDTYDTLIPGIRKVTAADVQRVAKTYIDPDHLAVVIVGDRKAIESGVAGLAEGPVVIRDLWGKPLP